ncbi:TGB3 [Rose virus A]|uniref:Movement protein TGBp3 n=1 Tax=Rose virus A TaxID=2650000 RepID=A0AAE6NRT5_9VIRU|nr:TGB3 [Rose virus A]QEV82107.1 TGB3 [Rose virus A]
MWDRSLISWYFAFFASLFVLIYAFLQNFCQCGRCPCTVRITGESILISGCEFDETFSEYAKGLQIPRHDL